MLHGFSTVQFLAGLALLGMLWYAGLYLFFDLKKNKRLSGSRSNARKEEAVMDMAGSSGGHWTNGSSSPGADNDMMGKAALPEGMSIVTSQEIDFVDLAEGADKADQLGLVPDLLEEIKSVFRVLAKEDGSKRDFMELMRAVKETYPGMASHPRIRVINGFIAAHASFHLSAEELENLWY